MGRLHRVPESSQFYSLRLPCTVQQFGFLVAKRSKNQATSELEIAFDHAILKNGTEIPLALRCACVGRWDVRRCEVHSWIG